MALRKALGTLLLGATLLAPAAFAQQKFTVDQVPQRDGPASTRVIKQDGAGKPYLVASTAAQDHTAMTAAQIAEAPRLKETTLADTIQQSSRQRKAISLDDCITCPPNLQLMPGTVEYNKADGTKEVYKDRLTPSSKFAPTASELCDRFADDVNICLYPGESAKAQQKLTKAQHKAVKEGEAKFKYLISKKRLVDQGFTAQEYKAIKDVFLDKETYAEVTRQEFDSISGFLPKDDEGKPFLVLPYFSVLDIKDPAIEDCSYGRVMVLRACDVPTPVVEVPPPVVETPPVVEVPPPVVEMPPVVEVPPTPVTVLPPIAPITPWYARAVAGTTGLGSSMEWNKPQNENCPTDLCTGSFANHELSGRTAEIEVGYTRPLFTASVSAEKTTMDVEKLEVSHASLQRFFESTGVEARDITLKARGAIPTDTPVKLYLAGEASKGDVTLKDATASRTEDVKALQGTAGAFVGDMTKSFGYAGAGYRVFDQFHLFSAPTYNTGVPATLEIKTPVAEVGGQLSLFNNRWDVFGNALYMFNSKAAEQKLDNRLDITVGTTVWIDNNGRFRWGVTGDYKKSDPLKLDMQGTPVYMQSIVPEDTVRGGLTIRF